MKVEKVVKPPQKPVVSSNLVEGVHPSAAIPRNAGEKSDDEAAQHVYCHGAEGESYEAARLHHLGNPISQAASKEAAYAYD